MSWEDVLWWLMFWATPSMMLMALSLWFATRRRKMEDELKEACKKFKDGHISPRQFKAELRDLLSNASEDQLLEFAEIVLVGLADEKGH